MTSRKILLIIILCVQHNASALTAQAARITRANVQSKVQNLTGPVIDKAQRDFIRNLPARGISAGIRFNRRGVADYIKEWKMGPSTSPRQFLRDNRLLFKLQDPDQELSLTSDTTDRLQFRHQTYQQYHDGIPVWNRGLRLHLKQDGELVVTGKSIPSQNAIGQRNISAEQAAATVLQDLGLNQAEWRAQLVYLDHEDRLVLSQHINVRRDAHIHWDYFIDAENGNIVKRYNRVHHQMVAAQGQDLKQQNRQLEVWQENNQYYLLDPRIPLDDAPYNPVNDPQNRGDFYVLDAQQSLGNNLQLVTSSSAAGPWDPAGVSTAYHMRRVYEYFKDTFAHNSYDNNNMNLQGIIHYDQDYNNAFWNGRSIILGDGDGVLFNSLASCLDITAHEMTHGVIQYTADFIYENQSGALNESFADVFAAFVDGNWVLGEDCVLRTPGFLRSLENPPQGLSSQPDKMSDYVNLPNTEQGDFGGVHVNSGIPNRAAYLITQDIGVAQAQQIYFRALSRYLGPASEFLQTRRALIQAATDLHGAASPIIEVIHAAWDEVEVFDDARGVPPQPVRAGVLRIDTPLLDFGEVGQGQSRTLNLRLFNDGNANLVIENISSDNREFVPQLTVSNIEVGTSREVAVNFTANQPGTHTGVLNIVYQGQAAAVQISLTAVTQNPLSTYLGKPGGIISPYFLMLLLLFAPIYRKKKCK